jgi:hypothetical protein
MATRVHLAAHLSRTGPDPDLGEPHHAFALDGWAWAMLSVWGASAVDLDWRLARISRRHTTLALRATTVDDAFFQLVILINGERAVRLAHGYFADFERAMELLTDHLDVGELAPDQPLEEAQRQKVAELEGEDSDQAWLLRVAAGEAPRQAFTNAGRLQAAEVAAVAEAAGLACDAELLERFFTGGLTPAEVAAERDWDNFGDLLLFLEALGLRGLRAHINATTEADEPEAGADEELREPQEAKRRAFGKRVAGVGCLLSIAAAAGVVKLGAELAGGWGAAGAVLVFSLLLALTSRWLWRRFVKRLKQAFGGDSLAAPEVPPAVLLRWRTLLFNWRDLVCRLGVAGSDQGRRPKMGLFDSFYSDLGVPTDPPGKRLIDLMTGDPSSLPGLAAEIRALRLALLDAEIAGADVERERAAYGALCQRLMASSA